MKPERFKGVFSVLLVTFFVFFGITTGVQASDYIQWSGAVYGKQAPTVSGSTTTQTDDVRLGGASIAIAQFPSVKTISGASGNFKLPGIPANQQHYFKVSKTGYITTNVGVKLGDVDIDNTACFAGSSGITPTCCPTGAVECKASYPSLPTCTSGGTCGTGMSCQTCPTSVPADICTSSQGPCSTGQMCQQIAGGGSTTECCPTANLALCQANHPTWQACAATMSVQSVPQMTCPTGTSCQACPANMTCLAFEGSPCGAGQTCMPTGTSGTYVAPSTCSFMAKLFAVSEGMKTFIESRSISGIDLASYGLIMIRLQDSTGQTIEIDTTKAFITVNGIKPDGTKYTRELSPDNYITTGAGVLLIPNLPPGDTVITIEGITGLTIPAITVPVFIGEITYYSVELLSATSAGTVTGKVTDTNNTPIQGATVNATPQGTGSSATAVTGSTGTFSLSLGQGSYKIQASADGYAIQYYPNSDRYDWASPLWIMPQSTMQEINFQLSAAKTIKGKVTDKTTGGGIANAWVNAWSNMLQASGGAQTGSDGSYTISVKPASDYTVNVNADGYAAQFYNNKKGSMEADSVDVLTANKTGIDFALEKGKSIKGTIKDENNSPISYMRVDAYSDSTGSGSGDNTKEDGTYTITVASASDYRVRSNPQCLTTQPSMGATPTTPKCYPEAFYGGVGKTVYQWAAAVFVDVTSADASNIDIKLGSGTTISGTVKGKDNTGIYNVQVNAFSPSGGGSATTDASGNFTIGVTPGSGYRVEAFSPDGTYPRVMWKGNIASGKGENDATTTSYDQATMLDVTANIESIDFVMSSGVTISGSIKDGSDQPISGVWVNAWSDTENKNGGGQSKGDGTFSFSVPEGSGYRISAYSPQYPNVFYKTDDATTCSTDCNPDKIGSTYNEATIFNFTAAEVEYTMPMMGPGTTQGTTIKLPPLPNGAKGVNIKFGSSGGTIEGIVKANGKPIAGVWVNAWSEGCTYGVGEPSKTDGTYKMKVLAGGCQYKVEAFTDKYIRQFYNNKFDWMEATPVAVTDANPSVTNINFNLSSGNSISGTVKTGTGTAVPQIWVNAFSESSSMGMGATTDATGSYTIFVRPAKDYKLSVWHPDYAPQTYNGKSDYMQGDLVDTTAGSKTGIDFVLSSGSTISGTVTKSGGGAPEADNMGTRGWVNAFSQSNGTGGGAPIGSDGKYNIKVPDAIDYRVQVFHPNYAPIFYNNAPTAEDATLVDATTNPTNINFTLSSGGTIKGQITDDQGGKSGVWVNAFSETMKAGFGESTDASGNYKIKGLPAGAGYKVSIYSPQFANVFYKEGAVNGTPDWKQATPLDLTGGVELTGKDIKLAAGRTITGTIKASSALSGNISVDAFSETLMAGRGEPVKYAAGDTSANFIIKGLPVANDYRVHVMADKYGNKFYKEGNANGTTDFIDATKIDISNSSFTLANEITLSTGASISGTIYADSTKAADKVIRNGWIQAMNPSAGEYQGTPIKSDGTYDIKGLTDGNKYTIQAMPEGYTPIFYTSTGTSANWVEPNVAATEAGTKGIDLVASKGYTISGQVLDSNNKGVPYAFIGIFGSDSDNNNLDDNPFFWSPMSDGNGNFKTPPLPAGQYLIQATAMKGAMGEGVGQDLGRAFYQDNGNKVITLGSADLSGKNITFQAATTKGKISGTITNDSATNDFGEIQVMIFNSTTGKMLHGKNKQDVKKTQTFDYVFEVEPGDYIVGAIGAIKGSKPAAKFYSDSDANGVAKEFATKITATANTESGGKNITLK